MSSIVSSSSDVVGRSTINHRAVRAPSRQPGRDACCPLPAATGRPPPPSKGRWRTTTAAVSTHAGCRAQSNPYLQFYHLSPNPCPPAPTPNPPPPPSSRPTLTLGAFVCLRRINGDVFIADYETAGERYNRAIRAVDSVLERPVL